MIVNFCRKLARGKKGDTFVVLLTVVIIDKGDNMLMCVCGLLHALTKQSRRDTKAPHSIDWKKNKRWKENKFPSNAAAEL